MRKSIPETMFTGREQPRLSALQNWVLDNRVTVRRVRKLQAQHVGIHHRLLQAVGGQLVLCLGLDDGKRVMPLQIQDIVWLAAFLVRMLALEWHHPAWRNHL